MQNVSKTKAHAVRRAVATYWLDIALWVGVVLIVAYWITWLGVLSVAVLGAVILRRQSVRRTKEGRREQQLIPFWALPSPEHGDHQGRLGDPAYRLVVPRDDNQREPEPRQAS